MSDGLQKPILRAPGKAACWGQPTPELYHEGGRDAAEAPTTLAAIKEKKDD